MGIHQVLYTRLTLGFFAKPQHVMHRLKKNAMKYFHQKPDGNQKVNITNSITYNHPLNEYI